VLHRFTNQTTLVTGGTSGIGLAIAEALAAEGAQVVAAGLNADIPQRESVRFVELDVTDAPAVEQLVNRFDELHCLVNAAGIIARQNEFDATRFTDVL
jgi:NAD(P)-dependent dehydrogenase (short-subunit alcohol dehydrogenase family)